jgi:hypothetical protein
LDEALAATLKAQQYVRATFGAGDDLQAKYRLAVTQQDEAEVRLAAGDAERAIGLLQTALQTIEEITSAAPRNRYYQYLRIQHLELLEEAYYSIEDISAGDPRKAAAVDRRIRELVREFLASDPADNSGRVNIATFLAEGTLALIQIDPRQAVTCARSAMTQWDQAVKLEARDQFNASRRARTLMLLALSLLAARRPEEAVKPAREASGTLADLMAAKPDGMRYQKTALFSMVVSGQTLAAVRRDAEALQVLEAAAALGEQMRTQNQAQLTHVIAATYAFDHLGEYWKSHGDLRRARDWFERSRQAWAARAERTPAVEQRRKQSRQRIDELQP